MGLRKDGFNDCVGAVNVLLNDRVVLQGQIIRNHEEDRKVEYIALENQNQFITLELTCDALIIRDNARLTVIEPTLFEEGDRVRINVSDISAIGPKNGCPDCDDDEDDD